MTTPVQVKADQDVERAEQQNAKAGTDGTAKEDRRHQGPRAGSISVSERQLDDGTAEIAVEGELDLSTAPHLKWPLLDSMKAGRTRLLVNLEKVTFIDSTALSVLVGAHRKLPEGAHMAIVCANPNVTRIFDIAGLDAVFALFPTSAEGRAYLTGRDSAAGSELAGGSGQAGVSELAGGSELAARWRALTGADISAVAAPVRPSEAGASPRT